MARTRASYLGVRPLDHLIALRNAARRARDQRPVHDPRRYAGSGGPVRRTLSHRRPPARRRGGQGLGFNGGQLLALAIGGCLCNDLRYAAHQREVALAPFELAVDVHIGEDGDVARVSVRLDAEGQRDRVAELLDEAVAMSTIVRAVTRGAPIDIALA